MMIDTLIVDDQVILVTTAPMHSVTAAMNMATLHRTAPISFLCQGHHATKTGLIQDKNTPTPKGKDHTAPTMGTDMGDISTDHNHTAISTVTGAAAVSEGTHHAPHLATAAAHAALQLMDTSIATCAMKHPTGIVTPHPTLATSPTNITHATSP